MFNSVSVKTFSWNTSKNDWLVRVRGISFERIVALIEQGELLDVVAHHNPSRYPNQKILIVNVQGYACLVPVVETDNHYVLKTIIPSRKATKRYLEARNE